MTARDETPSNPVWRTEEALGRKLDSRVSTKSIGVAFDDVLRTCADLERAFAASQAECERLRRALERSQGAEADCAVLVRERDQLRIRLARVEAAARELTGLLEKAGDNGMLYLSPDTEAAYKALRTALSEQKDDRVLDQAWYQVSGKQPPPHGRYEVYQAGRGDFVATVCYGMHAPWWVPEGQEPIDMLPSDTWRAASQEPPR